MDTSNAEHGLAHVVKAPGYVQKAKIYEKVDDAEAKGLVRKMSTPVPSMFLKPQAPVHFEMWVDGRLCMVRGIFSKETTIADFDAGYVRDNHVWLIFSSKTARYVGIDLNPTPARDSIWIRPAFLWDHSMALKFSNQEITEPTASLMDRLACVVSAIATEDHLDSLTCEASRLRCIFVDAILKGATEMPDVKLPLGRSGMWTKNSVLRCWVQAKAFVNPMVIPIHMLEERK